MNSVLREAPPIKPPSMSCWASRPAALAPFMEPPYWMRTLDATAGETLEESQARILAWTSWACSGDAVTPVPMAQTGSYATAIESQSFSVKSPFNRAPRWSSSTTASILPASRSSRVSPTQNMTLSPALSAFFVFVTTRSEDSFWFVRRSEWPRITHVHPISFSISAGTSPVYAPYDVALQSCAPTAMSLRIVFNTSGMNTYGTPTTTSAHGGIGPASFNPFTSFDTEPTVPFDFQFPPIRYFLGYL
mmetsp:Transcript_18399/g.56465  ORF Transcript_18399/g.56465 Transcript_18399/m.56465 type:complete len:247 (+) Transcript_18399:533-1273(+)